MVDAIGVSNGEVSELPSGTSWALRGFTSNVRYATGAEVTALRSVQPALNRPEATCAALIPIRKSAAWWDLAQDERRAIFEERSRHTAIGMEYLPAVARRLHHCRDLGEPFDFLTWFEFAPENLKAFDQLVSRLRETREWNFVEREIDIRLERDA
jgi:chlorite dismutase